jgi:hypothetical protein
MKKILQSAAVWLLLATLNAHLATVLAQGTAFTYQGRLNSSGSPASGSYDLVFTLYNTNTAGIAIAEPATNSAVAVTNGLFTTLVDFGPGVFTGTSNWLAIAVSTNGANTFSLLTPRQQVTPTPYALYSANAGTAATASSVPAADVTGTLGLGQLPPAVLTNSATSVSLSGAFIGNGGGLTNIADWHLGGNTGTTNGNYLGTTDNQPLEIRVGGVRAGWISPSNGSPNVVFGPAQNVISNTTAGASILGGINNTIGTNSSYSVISGGQQNSISNNADHSVLGGGNGNTIQAGAYQSFIGGGINNNIQATAYLGFIGGGYGNIITSTTHWAVIGGGYQNNVQGNYDFLGGGDANAISGSADSYASLVGGIDNTIGTGTAGAFLGGGGNNSILNNDSYSVLVGGYDNIVNNSFGFIGGGYRNTISNVTDYAFIGGGQQNTIQSQALDAFLGGGQQNTIGPNQDDYYAVLVGGQQNTIQGNSFSAFLGGGSQNSISNNAPYSFLGGGQANFVGGDWATVGGGYQNSVTANYATVPGGANNLAGGLSSFAAGSGAQAVNPGAFVWADAEGVPFASTNANSFNVRANGGVRLVTSGAGLAVDGLPVLAGNNGSGLINLNASQLTSGTVPLAQLPASLAQLPGIVVTNNEPFVTLGTLYSSNLLTGGTLTLPLPAKIMAYSTSILTVDANANSYFGLQAGSGSGSDNTAVGVNAFSGNGSGNKNVAIGESALGNSTNDNQLVAIGYQALENDNALGAGSPSGNGENTAVGYQALKANTVGAANTATGYKALYSSSSGLQNVAVGDYALVFSQGDQGNVAVGNNSLGNLGVVTGLITPGGGYNTAVGFLAFGQLVGGTGNIAIGQEAGYNNYSGDNNIYIGNQGQNSDTAIIRIGTQGTQTATYLAGTVYANGIALTSDRNLKENFKPVDNQEVLAKVASLPLTEWNYKKESKDVQHIGPMAQDFQAAFGLDGADDKHISVVDEGGVALAAIQGLNQKVEEKDVKIKELEARLKKLEALMTEKLGGVK